MSELLHLRISSVEDLTGQCARFHDLPFRVDAQVFDATAGIWTATFIRATDDATRITRRRVLLIVQTIEFPLVETRIVIHGVNNVAVRDRADIGTYTFRRLHRTTSGVRFEFHQDLDIDVKFDEPLRAEFQDVRELTGQRGRITSLGFMDFGIQVDAA